MAEAERLMQDAVVQICRVSGDAAGKDGREAFGSLKVAMNKAGTNAASLLVEVTDDHSRVLGFVADVGLGVKMLSRQAESILLKLLQTPAWEESAAGDPALLAKLRASSDKVKELLQAHPEPEPQEQAASAATTPVVADAAPAAQGMQGSISSSSPASSPPQPPTPPGVVADTPAAESPPTAVAAESPPTAAAAVAAVEPFARAVSDADAAPEVSGVAAAAAETRSRLRKSFQAMNELGFEAEDSRGDTERAVSIFKELCTATNRAHFEHARRTRPAPAKETADGGATGRHRPSVSSSSLTGADGVDQGGRRELTEEESDFLAEALDGLAWEPRRTLMFLFNLARAKKNYSKRIQCTAQMLTQISATYRDAVRSDSFLAAWLGACRGGTEECAQTVSYGFASSLRWAAWEAAWHLVQKRKGKEESSQRHHGQWRQREQALQASSELPQEALKLLLQAAWAAAHHTALVRFPEESQGWLDWAMSPITGPKEDTGPYKDEFHEHFDKVLSTGALAEELRDDLRWMIWNTAWYVADKAKGYNPAAQEALVRAERHLQRAFRGEAQWRGANLGGWFLLEPGPCSHFWQGLPAEAQREKCEWGACQTLGPAEARRRLTEHRRTYFSREDYAEMKAAGLTHVRLCVGSWCVAGPRPGEPYVGPCLEALDRALDHLESEGMRVLLDLHGCVGGESAEPPCGHRDSAWNPGKWDPKASLAVLKTLAERYAGRVCICGLGVANEPAENMPARELARYYEEAVETVRRAGMRAGEVAVVLPIFTEYRVKEFLHLWEEHYPRYEDCVFDVHLYQCFGSAWSMLSLERHMQLAAQRRDVLKKLPACCVSEWSCALPSGATRGRSEEELREIYKRFARIQLEAYETATHGWFFWTWRDSAGLAWNLQECIKQGVLTVPTGGRDTNLLTP